ncbi:MAG: EthD domain-containing protein [Acidimicrobiales bacterium]
MLELVALGSDRAAAEAAALITGGTAYVNQPNESDKRPYSTMLRASTDEIEHVRSAADVALYVCFARIIKPLPEEPSPERAIGAFLMVGHPDLTHRQSDDHWRFTHAPLALKSHSAMCDYTQLSVVATLSGMEIDGIALCAFDSREDLSAKFFNDDDAKAAIGADVAKFADTKRSPRRVILNQL